MESSENLKTKVNLDLKGSFNQYKDFVLPVFVIVSCFLVLISVIVPQFSQYLNSRQELSVETQKLDALKNNYNFLSNLDPVQEESDLKTLSFALPPTKDFVGILNAISVVSSKTGVSIGDFSFSIGDLSKPSVELNSFIETDINLGGNFDAIAKFVNEFNKTSPLSQITSVKFNSNQASLIIRFYYKSFPPENIADDSPVVPLSTQYTKLIKDIYTWNNAEGSELIPFGALASPSASSSAQPSESGGENTSPF